MAKLVCLIFGILFVFSYLGILLQALYIYIYIYIYIHTYIYICVCVCVCVVFKKCCSFLSFCLYFFLCVWVCAYVCVCLCVSLCMFFSLSLSRLFLFAAIFGLLIFLSLGIFRLNVKQFPLDIGTVELTAGCAGAWQVDGSIWFAVSRADRALTSVHHKLLRLSRGVLVTLSIKNGCDWLLCW